MSTKGKSIEYAFNYALGELAGAIVKRHNPDAKTHTEKTGMLREKGKHVDVLITRSNLAPCAIEASYTEADAEKDAIARLGKEVIGATQLIMAACMVLIPCKFRTLDSPEIKRTLKEGATLKYAVLQKTGCEYRRWPAKGLVEGDTEDMVALLLSSSPPREEVARVADEVATMIERAASAMENLPARAQKEMALSIRRGSPFQQSMKTVMVLWLNALHTQYRLSRHCESIEQLNLDNGNPVNVGELVDCWRRILKINWRAIFKPAVDVLDIAKTFAIVEAAQALEVLTQAVASMEKAGIGPHINLGAELFPKLIPDRKESAAFYTNSAVAELLATLTIRRQDIDDSEWQDPGIFRRRTIADLACGTGTLLRAGYHRARLIHESNSGTRDGAEEFHRAAMEKGLIGADISPIAAHLTSSSLAALGEQYTYGETNVGYVEVAGGDAMAGSLEFFTLPYIQNMFTKSIGSISGGADYENDDDNDGRESSKLSISLPPKGIDWVLMNPPYSRTRAGQSAFNVAGVNESERKALQKKWGKLIKDQPCNKKAGMAASFLCLALKRMRKEGGVNKGGRIGFVLPLTAAFADSWSETRKTVEREFTDILAVTVAAGAAERGDAMSADTGMEEMLLVATQRTSGDRSSARINCITLHEPVTRMGEAREIGRLITDSVRDGDASSTQRPFHVGDTEIGNVYVLEKQSDGSPWSALGVIHRDLARTAECLTKGSFKFLSSKHEISLGMTTIEELFDVGPSHDSIGHLRPPPPPPKNGRKPDTRGAFELSEVINENDAIGEDRSLWAAYSKTQTTLNVLPTHKGVPIPGRNHNAMREQSGRLFYARNMRWTSQALLSACTEIEVMGGSSWTSLGHKDIRVRCAFALWANSTFGILVHWTQGQRTQAGRARVQVRALGKIPCPRFDKLPDAALDHAREIYLRLEATQLMAACKARHDPARHTLDAMVIDFMGMSGILSDDLAKLRCLWCDEPSVYGGGKPVRRKRNADTMPHNNHPITTDSKDTTE